VILLAPAGPSPVRADELAFPGGVLWHLTFDPPPLLVPAFDDTSAYVVLQDGTVRAIDHATGATRWSAQASSSVVPASSGRVLVGADGSIAWGLDTESGRALWRHDLGAKPSAAPVATPAGALFLVDTGDLVMIAWDQGREVWKTPLPDRAAAPLASDEDRAWVGCEDGRMLALKLVDGQIAWTRRLPGRILVVTPIGDRLVVGSADNFVYVLRASDGDVNWRWRTGGDVTARAAADRRRIYVVSLDAMLRALDRRHGDLRWQRPLTTRAVGAPLLAGNLLILAGVSPELRAFRTSDGGSTASAPMPGRALHSPYLAPARDQVPTRIVLLTAGGHLMALGQTVEPMLVPLDVIPGIQLKPEVLPIIR
jgi:outer membrane protein assembly factor BamB